MLLPMHIPVFLGGLICGWKYGGAVGFILPLFRSILFGMPVLFPNAVSMAVELCVYGLVSGMIYSIFKKKDIFSVYCAILPAMVIGRVAWGIVQAILLGFGESPFTWKMFWAGAFLNAVPGIVLQLILVPAIISLLRLSGKKQAKPDSDYEKSDLLSEEEH